MNRQFSCISFLVLTMLCGCGRGGGGGPKSTSYRVGTVTVTIQVVGGGIPLLHATDYQTTITGSGSGTITVTLNDSTGATLISDSITTPVPWKLWPKGKGTFDLGKNGSTTNVSTVTMTSTTGKPTLTITVTSNGVTKPITVPLSMAVKTATGAGGVRLTTSDLSGAAGASNMTGIPATMTVEVPDGIQIDNVVLATSIETTEDYVLAPQPRPIEDLLNDDEVSLEVLANLIISPVFALTTLDGFAPSPTWTPLSGTPSHGWSGLYAFDSLSSAFSLSFLNSIGVVPQDDFLTVRVRLEYDYQGQRQGLEIAYDVFMKGDN